MVAAAASAGNLSGLEAAESPRQTTPSTAEATAAAADGEGWAYGSDLQTLVLGGVALAEQQIRASSLQGLLTAEEGFLSSQQAEARLDAPRPPPLLLRLLLVFLPYFVVLLA